MPSFPVMEISLSSRKPCPPSICIPSRCNQPCNEYSTSKFIFYYYYMTSTGSSRQQQIKSILIRTLRSIMKNKMNMTETRQHRIQCITFTVETNAVDTHTHTAWQTDTEWHNTFFVHYAMMNALKQRCAVGKKWLWVSYTKLTAVSVSSVRFFALCVV